MKCVFFDHEVSKEHFHCDGCGICRVGGRDNFFHCDTCNACYPVQIRSTHVCVSDSMRGSCPVCCEDLFHSTQVVMVLRCGHTIHRACLEELIDHGSFQCPCCNKSLLAAEEMQAQWDALDLAVAQTPMPQELAGIDVRILCNDCHTRSDTKLHVIGHKCASCGSYNTRRV
jgi:RING finger/CHY zinc finger protein 1